MRGIDHRREDVYKRQAPDSVARLNQFRDCLLELREEASGALGIGNCQTWVQGPWPALGLPEG